MGGRKNEGVEVPGAGGGSVGSRGTGSYKSSMILTSVLSHMSGTKEGGVKVGEAVPNTSTLKTCSCIVETSGCEAPGVTREVSEAEEVDAVEGVTAACWPWGAYTDRLVRFEPVPVDMRGSEDSDPN